MTIDAPVRRAALDAEAAAFLMKATGPSLAVHPALAVEVTAYAAIAQVYATMAVSEHLDALYELLDRTRP